VQEEARRLVLVVVVVVVALLLLLPVWVRSVAAARLQLVWTLRQ
jgi:hypothetical protein